MKKYLYLSFLVLLAATFYMRSNYRGVTDIQPSVQVDPIQTELVDAAPIRFSKDSFNYVLHPLFNYEISALVVHTKNYDQWYSPTKLDNTFPTDLCLLWGSNVKNQIYQNRSLQFSQDSRFCYWQWTENLNFSQRDVANNHIVVQDPVLEKKIKSILPGDQIKIKGLLVDVEATNTGKVGSFDYASANWHTSTTRDDTGAGACEVIYVQSVEILKAANPLARHLYVIAWVGLLALFLHGLVLFIKDIRQGMAEPK